MGWSGSRAVGTWLIAVSVNGALSREVILSGGEWRRARERRGARERQTDLGRPKMDEGRNSDG